MIKIASIFIICALFVQDGKSKLQKRNSEKDANEYIDKLLEDTIAKNRHNIEPYRAGNTTFEFERKALLVKISGKLELYDMVVSGLSSIHRDGDCEKSSSGGVSKISVNLGMGVLELVSSARVSFMNYGPTVQLFAKIGYVSVHLKASRDDNAGMPPSIYEFKIYDTKGEEATVSGLGPLNYVANIITSSLITIFKGTILRGIESRLEVALDDMIKTSNFPLIE